MHFVIMPLLVGAVAALGVGVPFLLSAGLLFSAAGVFVTVKGKVRSTRRHSIIEDGYHRYER
jgi:hypothetical protein